MSLRIEIYTTPVCPYCDHAKKLLDQKGVSYEVIDVSQDSSLRQHMVERSNGRKTVPQIFINDLHVGGCDDLYALDKEGKLNEMLDI